VSWTTIVTWLIVGALAGAFAGMVVKQKKRGYGSLIFLGGLRFYKSRQKTSS